MSEPTPPGSAGLRPASAEDAGRRTALPGMGRRLSLVLPVVLVLAGVGLWFAIGLTREPGDDPGRLQGEWAVSANGREGGVTVRVEGDRWTYVAGGLERQSYRVTLRPGESPKEIDLAQLDADGKAATNTVGRTDLLVGLHGVYAFDGDAVTVVLAPGVEPRPKSVTDSGDAQVLTLTRAKR